MAVLAPGVRLMLLDGFELAIDGHVLHVPTGSQRVLALLAMHDRPLQRTFVAGVLWANQVEQRAVANLRTALCRLPQAAGRLVKTIGRQVSLAQDVTVDVRETVTLAHRLIDPHEPAGDFLAALRVLTADLLPDWYEDWVLAEQESYRELRMHALEALCDKLTAIGRFAEAVEAGLAAAAAEPLRESARHVLIRAHLAEGNRVAAMRQYARFQSLLGREVGLEPSPALRELMAGVHRT